MLAIIQKRRHSSIDMRAVIEDLIQGGARQHAAFGPANALPLSLVIGIV